MRASRRRPRTESIWWLRPRRPRMRVKRPRRLSGRPRRSPRRHRRRSPRRAPWHPRRRRPWRTTPSARPRRVPRPRHSLPGEQPSTGSDPLTVSTEGIEFPFPEYTNNIIAQIAIRWQRPQQNTPLDAEIGFLVHRDGSISDMQFIKRSGSFGFDLEAQGAIEEAGRRKAFGPLPDGWTSDVLFVRFYFSGKRQ